MKIIDDGDEYNVLSEVEYGKVFKFGEKFYVKVDISVFIGNNRIQYNSSFALSLDNFSIVRFCQDNKTKVIIYEPEEIHLVRKG